MKQTFGIIILISFITFTAAAQEAKEVADILESADQAFNRGNELINISPSQSKEHYILASFYYNSLLETGIRNSKLYYNTGNAFYRSGQIGKAILMYKRALLFSPTDPQILFNLNQARSVQKNRLSYKSSSELLQIILFPHYKIPFVWKLRGFIIFNLIFWGSLILRRFRKGPYLITIISAAFTLLLVSSLFFDWQSLSTEHGVIITETSIGRMGDSINYEASFETSLFQGVEFTIIERRVGWILAKLDNGDITWLEEKDCEVVEEL